MPMSRERRTAWQRARRASDREAAIAAGTYVPPGRPRNPDKVKCHGDRAGQRRRARERLSIRNGDNGWVVGAHPIMDEAFHIADRHVARDRRTVMYRPWWEEAVCVAALAICAGEDPDEAVKAYLRIEREWWYWSMPLFEESPELIN